jgi:hypothetical protein
MGLGMHFSQFSCVKQVDSIWSGEPFPVTVESLHRVASNMRKRVNVCIAERGGHFQHFTQHCFLFSNSNVIYFLINRKCDFSIILCISKPEYGQNHNETLSHKLFDNSVGARMTLKKLHVIYFQMKGSCTITRQYKGSVKPTRYTGAVAVRYDTTV